MKLNSKIDIRIEDEKKAKLTKIAKKLGFKNLNSYTRKVLEREIEQQDPHLFI